MRCRPGLHAGAIVQATVRRSRASDAEKSVALKLHGYTHTPSAHRGASVGRTVFERERLDKLGGGRAPLHGAALRRLVLWTHPRRDALLRIAAKLAAPWP